MKAWKYNDLATGGIVCDLGLEFLNARVKECRYCKHRMVDKEISNMWNFKPIDYIKTHNIGLDFEWITEEQGVPLEDLTLRDGDPGEDVYCYSFVCKVCDWWVLEKRVWLAAVTSQIWELIFASAGILRNLDLSDISLPIEEIRKYLAAKYESRFSLHPRKFEEVVTSVFRDLGYNCRLIAYTNDGGVDIILSGVENSLIGVQVKRYKGKIKVEQIRSFLGAMILKNCVKGIFVTTSGFQKGACNLAKLCNTDYRPIELMDAEKFFKTLEIAQINSFDRYENYPLCDLPKVPNMHLVSDIHLNSL